MDNSHNTSPKKSKRLKILLFLVLFFCVERFCHKETEGFRISKMLSDLSYDAKWDIAPLSDEAFAEIKADLNQPYHFLSSGGQCYAFVSADGKQVLKVFKHHHMRINSLLNRFTLPESIDIYRRKLLGGRETPQERLHNMFMSCKIGYEDLKNETALSYLHLNKTHCFNQKIVLIDKLNIAYTLDVDNLEFALQKKADLIYPKLHTLIEQKDIEGAKRHIDSLIALIVHRSQLGIADNDAMIYKNFGFVGDQAIGIDLGCMRRNETLKEPFNYKQELLRQIGPFRSWLKEQNPELSRYTDNQIETLISS